MVINENTNLYQKRLSISPQTNTQPSLIEKIKSLIGNLISFIQNHTSSVHRSESTISKQATTPLNLSHEILRVLDEEKSAQGSKKDLDFITFFFHEAICDITKDASTNKSIYDVLKNNKPVLEELNYEEIYGAYL